MAASITFTPARARDVRKVTCDVTSAADGSCSFGTSTFNGGLLTHVVINPDGTAVPTAAWDLTITDENGLDVLGGQGANLSETATVSKAPYRAGAVVAELPITGTLTINATNMGDTKKVQIVLMGKMP